MYSRGYDHGADPSKVCYTLAVDDDDNNKPVWPTAWAIGYRTSSVCLKKMHNPLTGAPAMSCMCQRDIRTAVLHILLVGRSALSEYGQNYGQ
jgi:hypothetical protein